MGVNSLAHGILDALVAAFATAGYPGFERTYVSDGSVAYDVGNLLVVEWEETHPAELVAAGGLVAMDISRGTVMLESVLSIHAMRYTPWPNEVADPPTPAAIEASAGRVHDDGRLVIDTLLVGTSLGGIFGTCRRVGLFGQQAVGPDGGIVGSLTRIAVSL